MKHAIIGTGNVGSALAERFADRGVPAVIANLAAQSRSTPLTSVPWSRRSAWTRR